MKFRILILRIFAVCALGALAFPALSWARTQTVLTGRTMGTFYRITLVTAQPLSRALWQKKIDIRLKEVNAHLSMYQPDSELSRFNKAPGNTPFPVSRDFFTVILQCQDLYQITNGAWDGTVKPLVDLWGFGTQKQPKRLPDPALIRSALGRTGFDTLRLDGQVLTKTREGVTLDLGSIAKGYGVDEIARLISEAGISDFLVEIGGELVASGRNKKRHPLDSGHFPAGQKTAGARISPGGQPGPHGSGHQRQLPEFL